MARSKNQLFEQRCRYLTAGALLAVFLVVALVFSPPEAHAAWTEPSDAPTGGNVAAPLNISNLAQTKVGELTLTSGLVADTSFAAGKVNAVKATSPNATAATPLNFGFQLTSGVWGVGAQAQNGLTSYSAGVFGISTGAPNTGRHIGLLGVAGNNSANSFGVYGTTIAGATNAYAGYFVGNVTVEAGNLVVTGNVTPGALCLPDAAGGPISCKGPWATIGGGTQVWSETGTTVHPTTLTRNVAIGDSSNTPAAFFFNVGSGNLYIPTSITIGQPPTEPSAPALASNPGLDGDGVCSPGESCVHQDCWGLNNDQCPATGDQVCASDGTDRCVDVPAAVTNDTTPPDTPILTSTTVISDAATIGWNTVADAGGSGLAGYQIWRCTGGGCTLERLIADAGTATSYQDVNLSSNTTYRYAVKAFDVAGNSSVLSNTIQILTQPDTTAPAVPGNLHLDGVPTANVVSLAWNTATDAGRSGLAAYRILRCAGTGCTPSATIATTAGIIFSDTGVAPATTYGYAVAALDGDGNQSGPSPTVTATTAEAPPAPDTEAPSVPANLHVNGTPSTSNTSLSWNAATDNVAVVGYKLYRCTPAPCTPAYFADVGNTTSFTDTDARPSPLRYQVTAYDAAGNESSRSTAIDVVISGSGRDEGGDIGALPTDLQAPRPTGLAANARQQSIFVPADRATVAGIQPLARLLSAPTALAQPLAFFSIPSAAAAAGSPSSPAAGVPKFTVNEGTIVIRATSTNNLELGENGTDITGVNSIYLRPNSLAQGNSVSISDPGTGNADLNTLGNVRAGQLCLPGSAGCISTWNSTTLSNFTANDYIWDLNTSAKRSARPVSHQNAGLNLDGNIYNYNNLGVLTAVPSSGYPAVGTDNFLFLVNRAGNTVEIDTADNVLFANATDNVIGIGLDDPDDSNNRLQVAGSDSPIRLECSGTRCFNINKTGGSGGFVYQSFRRGSGDDDWNDNERWRFVSDTSDDRFTIGTGSASVLTLSQAGNVGINTTSPDARLVVDSGTAGQSGLRLARLAGCSGALQTQANGTIVCGSVGSTLPGSVDDYIYDAITPPGGADVPQYAKISLNSGATSLGPARAITGATAANPVVVTAVGHGFETGDLVVIRSVVGMRQLNEHAFRITRIDADRFSLNGVNGTGYTAYTSGGTAAEFLNFSQQLGGVLTGGMLAVGRYQNPATPEDYSLFNVQYGGHVVGGGNVYAIGIGTVDPTATLHIQAGYGRTTWPLGNQFAAGANNPPLGQGTMSFFAGNTTINGTNTSFRTTFSVDDSFVIDLFGTTPRLFTVKSIISDTQITISPVPVIAGSKSFRVIHAPLRISDINGVQRFSVNTSGELCFSGSCVNDWSNVILNTGSGPFNGQTQTTASFNIGGTGRVAGAFTVESGPLNLPASNRSALPNSIDTGGTFSGSTYSSRLVFGGDGAAGVDNNFGIFEDDTATEPVLRVSDQDPIADATVQRGIHLGIVAKPTALCFYGSGAAECVTKKSDLGGGSFVPDDYIWDLNTAAKRTARGIGHQNAGVNLDGNIYNYSNLGVLPAVPASGYPTVGTDAFLFLVNRAGNTLEVDTVDHVLFANAASNVVGVGQGSPQSRLTVTGLGMTIPDSNGDAESIASIYANTTRSALYVEQERFAWDATVGDYPYAGYFSGRVRIVGKDVDGASAGLGDQLYGLNIQGGNAITNEARTYGLIVRAGNMRKSTSGVVPTYGILAYGGEPGSGSVCCTGLVSYGVRAVGGGSNGWGTVSSSWGVVGQAGSASLTIGGDFTSYISPVNPRPVAEYIGVRALATGGGFPALSTDQSFGIMASGGEYGVYGAAGNVGAVPLGGRFGGYFVTADASTTLYGVYAKAGNTTAASTFGIYASQTGTDANDWAGYFEGKANITADLAVGGNITANEVNSVCRISTRLNGVTNGSLGMSDATLNTLCSNGCTVDLESFNNASPDQRRLSHYRLTYNSVGSYYSLIGLEASGVASSAVNRSSFLAAGLLFTVGNPPAAGSVCNVNLTASSADRMQITTGSSYYCSIRICD